MMNAYYLRSDAREEIQMLSDALDAAGVPCSGRIRKITANGQGWNDWHDVNGHYSMHVPSLRSVYPVAAVSPKLRLFDNAWTRALLAQVNRSVMPGGAVILPVLEDERAASLGFISRSAIIGIFGNPEWERTEGGLARFHQSLDIDEPRSILSWVFEDFGMIALDYLNYRISGSSDLLTEEYREFLVDDEGDWSGRQPDLDRVGKTSIELNQTIPWLVQWANYSVGGIGYKSAIVQFIINQYLDDRQDLQALDIGGGAGLLAVELMLQNPRIKLAVVREPAIYNLVLARRLYHYYPELAGRFALSIGFAEDMTDNRRYDVVTMIGSLLYVPRDKTAAVLDHAWEKLKQGGILIVHENIKNPSFEKDYEVMFSVKELNKMLGRYGDIDCFMSTAATRIDRARVGEKAVFRVVRKR